MRRTSVLITGRGAIGAFGCGVPALWDAVVGGRVAARLDPQLLGGSFPVCRVDGAIPAGGGVHGEHRLDRSARFALVAAEEAAAQAQLAVAPVSPRRLAVVIGTSRGPVETVESACRKDAGGGRIGPSLAIAGTIASISGAVSMAHSARGPGMTVSAACASAALAIATAAMLIESGECDAVIAGGAEALLTPAVLAGLASAGILGRHEDPALACRPFDRRRNGTVFGEGAGMLVLESERSAAIRGVPGVARLAGWSCGSEALHRAAEDDSAAELEHAMRSACGRAGVDPSRIDYINAHGTGTRMNDRNEAAAIRRCVGDRGRLPVCSSTKPITGHCAGATPALEAIITIEALRRGIAPPTATCEDVDPECPVDPVCGHARRMPIRAAMSNSLGFWGGVGVLVFTPAS